MTVRLNPDEEEPNQDGALQQRMQDARMVRLGFQLTMPVTRTLD